MTFDWHWVRGELRRDGAWLRFGNGIGYIITRYRPLYAERHGHVRRWRLLGKWRVLELRPTAVRR